MIKLINANCVEILNTLENKEDYIFISDPPYNINFKYNKYKDNLKDEEYIKLISNFKDLKVVFIHYPEEFIKYFIPALGLPDKIITWCYNTNLPGRQHRLIGFWNIKPNLNLDKQPYKNPKDKRVKARIDNGSEGARLYDWWNDIQLYKNVVKNKENNTHPCPVPIKLMERIIKITEAEKVIDPFMGSGTTGIACKNTNRDFIGIELDEDYFNLAKERLK